MQPSVQGKLSQGLNLVVCPRDYGHWGQPLRLPTPLAGLPDTCSWLPLPHMDFFLQFFLGPCCMMAPCFLPALLWPRVPMSVPVTPSYGAGQHVAFKNRDEGGDQGNFRELGPGCQGGHGGRLCQDWSGKKTVTPGHQNFPCCGYFLKRQWTRGCRWGTANEVTACSAKI